VTNAISRYNNAMEETANQHKKQYDWLKGYQFVKGQSGNPSGRPIGRKSMKQFAKEYLESLPDDEKIEFMKTLPSELIWKMSEGMPQTNTDITTGGKPIIQIAPEIIAKHDLNTSPEPNS
jgi:hypothetical protein